MGCRSPGFEFAKKGKMTMNSRERVLAAIIRTFPPDLVTMGIDMLNPIQWVCPGMDRVEPKKEFGNRVCFHGAVENQRILPFGTPEEVRAEVRDCIDMLAIDGTGYMLAPCHALQANTPIENILAVYDEAWKNGKRC